MNCQSLRSCCESPQPLVPMLGHKGIIVEMGIGGIDAVDLFALAGAEGFVFVEAPEAFEQSLAAQDFVKPGDAAGETIRGIEEGGVAVGDFDGASQHLLRDRRVAQR